MKNTLTTVFCLLVILALSSLMLVSCTKVETSNRIYPDVHIVGDRIGISYQLGDILVNDELEDLSNKMFDHFKNHKDNIVLTLHVYYNDAEKSKTEFTYYINGIKLCTNDDVVDVQTILAHKNSIPGLVYNGELVSSAKESEVVKETVKVKESESFKPEPKTATGNKKL